MAQAVSRRPLTPRPCFAPGSADVRFMMDSVALGQVFLRVLRLSPVINPPWLSLFIYHLGDAGDAVQRRNLTPST
jgi:hypothetical protein